MVKNKFIQQFSAYAQTYNFDDKIIALKFQHSLSVANYCYEISSFLFLTETQKQTAFVLGLVHELGAFEAWATKQEFFNNTQTLKLLFDDKLIENYKLSPSQNKTIYYVLKLLYSPQIGNNQLEAYTKKLKNGQEKKQEVLTLYKVLKDADTLDFFGMIKRKLMPNIQSENFTKTSLSAPVLQAFNAGKKIEHSLIKSNIDKVLFFISFYYGLNFPISKTLALKMDFAQGIAQHYSDFLTQKQQTRLGSILKTFAKKHK